MPRPNQTCVVLCDAIAPSDMTTTGFVAAFDKQGHVVLVHELERCRYELPGGHIDPGENAVMAASREAYEETGAHVENLFPIGYLRQVVRGQIPPDYRYPAPYSFQQFFVADLNGMDPYTSNAECGQPILVGLKDALTLLDPRHGTLLNEAWRVWRLNQIQVKSA